MSILSSLKSFFFGPHVDAKTEQPVNLVVPTAPPVVEQPPAPVVEAAPAADKKPRAPRKPKDDSWLKADASSKRPSANKPQSVVGKQTAKPAAKTPKKK